MDAVFVDGRERCMDHTDLFLKFSIVCFAAFVFNGFVKKYYLCVPVAEYEKYLT